MLIQTDLDTIGHSKATILTIGTFDGIHLGHQEILKRLITESHQFGCRSVLLTFEPHPQTIIRPDRSPQTRILTTIEEKKDILEKLGLDILVVAKFDLLLASKTGEEFIKEILVEKIGMRKCVIGHDHVFGKNRSGNFELLENMSSSYAYEVEEIDAFTYQGTIVKSTLVRNLLREGNIESANNFLNRPYLFTGKVVSGDGRGKKIGFPTANITGHPLKLVPKNGVYACRTLVNGKKFNAVTNIGVRPTFDSLQEASMETHILEFESDLYGEEIQLEFLYRIRDEIKFTSAEELKKQISLDIHTALNKGFSTN